jgi:hypothetical protein
MMPNTITACVRCLCAALMLLVLTPAYAQLTPPPGSLAKPQARAPAATSPSGGSTVPLQNGFTAGSATATLYQLPAGAYVLSYQDATGAMQQFDATVTWDPRQTKHNRREVPDDMTISFGGRQFAGVLAAGSNRFASSQTVSGRPLLDGALSADGAMSGNYFADDHGYPVRNPFQYTLNLKPIANLGTEQRARSGVAVSPASPGSGNGTNAIAGTRPGSREALNPQPLPPMPGPNWNARPGDASSLNPQPLPPTPGPNWNAKPGDANSLSPQPLPPKPEPNWNTNTAATGSLKAQSLTSSASIAANSRSERTGISQPAQNRKTVATTQGARTELNGASGAVSDAAARRLRAAGLEPTSPTFRKQLDDRLQTIAKNLTSQSVAASVKTPAVDLVRAKLGTHANIAMAKVQPQSAANRVDRSTIIPLPAPAPGASPTTFDALPPFSILDGKVPPGVLTMPGAYMIPFIHPKDRARELGLADTASVRITVPACGVDVTHAAPVLTADQMGPVLADLESASPGWHFEGREFAIFIALSDWIEGEFPLGAQQQHGTLTLAVNDMSVATDWNFAASKLDSRWSAVVNSAAPFLGTNSLGLTTDNATFAQPAIERVNLSDQPMEGQDVLGTGMQLGAGYVAVAEILSSQSVADVGNDTSPDNAYRGASVVVQPQSNRLQTTVKWHIGPGDSLQYYLRWTLTGPVGQRALMTFPKQGVCDS